ncbi:MAG TPA: NAD(P)-dependent oxidoreductase [Gemmatimonadales bacterium]|nr:NAD(P)-dependent oxidoreductase [Gemmatimonadales bacterium]
MSQTIGFLGAGAMGAPMAANLIAAGFPVRLWNRSPEKARAVDRATVVATPKDAAKDAGIVISMLADDASVNAVVQGPDGLLASMARGSIHVSMSTLSVAGVKRLAAQHGERGIRFLAAPVFGRPEAARAKMLFIVPGGAPQDIAALTPLFNAMGQGIFPFATPEQAALAKLAGNFLIGATIESVGEALALAEKGGLDPEAMLNLLTGTIFGSPVVKNYGGRIARTEFTPAGFALPLAQKDFRLIREAARDAHVSLPVADLVADRLAQAIQAGRTDHDFAGFATVIREEAGLPVARAKK